MTMFDWGQVLTIVVVGLMGALSAIQAYLAKRQNDLNHSLTTASIAAVATAGIAPLPHVSPVGGGSAEVAATVLIWLPASYIPTWSQNTGPLPDGNLDPEHWNDCGETCVAMIVAGVWGVPMDPGGVRQFLSGVGGSGLTDGAALVRALAHYSVKSHVVEVANPVAWGTMAAWLGSQRCVIMLGTWPTPGKALHWMVGVTDGESVVQYVNPWAGVRSFLGRADWTNCYAGQLVLVDSHNHFDARTWATPT